MKPGPSQYRRSIPQLWYKKRGKVKGILLGTKDASWKDQLRMPLIQKALAEKYVRPAQDVMVGIQAIDGSSLEVVTFSPSQIREAEREFKDLGERIKTMTQ